MVDAEKSKVVLIDCDGLVVPGFLPAGVLGTPMCMAPELMMYLTSPQKATAKPSSWTDLHALATLIYWLLFQRHPLIGPKQNHPDPAVDEALSLGERALFIEDENDKSNNFPNIPFAFRNVLTPGVQGLVKQAFGKGLHNPKQRPSAANWERFLTRMIDSVVPCDSPQCPVGSYVFLPGQTLACPACGTPTRSVSTLPILHMHSPSGRNGYFSSDLHYKVVGWPGRDFHIWHAIPGKMPGPGVDLDVKAQIDYDSQRKEWYFVNKDLAEVRMLDSTGHKEIAPGKRQKITDGVRLLLGPPKDCRMAYVEMIQVK